MMNKNDMEQMAMEAALQPLADYVVKIGTNKGLGDYKKTEILGLVETVVEAYQTTLQELYKDEVPF